MQITSRKKKKNRQFISQQPGDSDREKSHVIYYNGKGKCLNRQNVFPWCASYYDYRSPSLLVVVKDLLRILTTAPAVCTWQQLFWRLISIRLLWAQTEAAYRYGVGPRLEKRHGEKNTVNTYLLRVLLGISEKVRLIKHMPNELWETVKKRPSWGVILNRVKQEHIHAS